MEILLAGNGSRHVPSFLGQGRRQPSHAWVLADKDHLDFIAYDSNQNDQIDFGELSNEPVP